MRSNNLTADWTLYGTSCSCSFVRSICRVTIGGVGLVARSLIVWVMDRAHRNERKEYK